MWRLLSGCIKTDRFLKDWNRRLGKGRRIVDLKDWNRRLGKGRRIVELKCLVNSLSHCLIRRMGPLFLTTEHIKGEWYWDWGYLYVQCGNCDQLKTVPYGSTYFEPSARGQRMFTVNTKLDAGKLFVYYLKEMFTCYKLYMHIKHKIINATECV